VLHLLLQCRDRLIAVQTEKHFISTISTWCFNYFVMSTPSPQADFPPLPLPEGISENYVHCPSNGLTFHVLEAGYTSQRDRPLVVLIHGYPELAFSWRKIMPSLARSGFYVVAYDQRGTYISYGTLAPPRYTGNVTAELSEVPRSSDQEISILTLSTQGTDGPQAGTPRPLPKPTCHNLA
jgi:predicted alpha/beta-fold hydrolase